MLITFPKSFNDMGYSDELPSQVHIDRIDTSCKQQMY
jgi:hypothetical protein